MVFTIKTNNNIGLRITNDVITDYNIDKYKSKVNRIIPLKIDLYFNKVININELLNFINFYNITTLNIDNIRCKENMDVIFKFLIKNNSIEELIIH